MLSIWFVDKPTSSKTKLIGVPQDTIYTLTKDIAATELIETENTILTTQMLESGEILQGHSTMKKLSRSITLLL